MQFQPAPLACLYRCYLAGLAAAAAGLAAVVGEAVAPAPAAGDDAGDAAGDEAGDAPGDASPCGEAAGEASAAGEAAGAGVGDAVVEPPASITERGPPMPNPSSSAVIIKVVAAAMVIFARMLAVPRGPKAVLDTEEVKSAPASALPGCRSTATTSTKQASRNSPYNK